MIIRITKRFENIPLGLALMMFLLVGQRLILEDGKVTGYEMPEEGQADAVT